MNFSSIMHLSFPILNQLFKIGLYSELNFMFSFINKLIPILH